MWRAPIAKLITKRLCLLVALSIQGANAQEFDPWTLDRLVALVRIQVGDETGTGFITRGFGNNYYVVTSTHVILPGVEADHFPPGCIDLPDGIELQQGQKGGPKLKGKCVFHIGNDVSVIQLEPRDAPFPTLPVSARDINKGDYFSLVGFPLGYERIPRGGKVDSTAGEEGTVVISASTAPGMSGGPYLSQGGSVVGIHRGGAKFVANFAHMEPFWRHKNDLEKILGPIAAPQLIPATIGRRAVEILRYKPANQNSIFEQFVDVVQQKLIMLPDGLASIADDERLSDLAIKHFDEQFTPAEIAERWKAADELVIMSGIIFPAANTVSSTIYVGEKTKIFATENLVSLLPIEPKQAITIRDSHTLMILYALAKDANARNKDSSVVIGYLSEARSIASDLANSDDRYKKLLDEINGILKELRK